MKTKRKNTVKKENTPQNTTAREKVKTVAFQNRRISKSSLKEIDFKTEIKARSQYREKCIETLNEIQSKKYDILLILHQNMKNVFINKFNMFMKQSSKTPEELEKLYKIQQLIQKEMEKSQILKKENEALQSEVNKLSKIKTDLTAQKDELVNNQQSLFQEVQKQTNLNNEYNVRMNAQNEENVIFDAIVGDNKQQNCNKISEIHENNNNESKTSTLPAGCCKEESTDEKFDEDNKTETTDFSEDFDTSQIEFSDSSSSKDISENDPAESFVTIQIEIQEEATKPHKRKVKTPKKEKAPRKERKQETKSRSLSNNSKIQLVPSELNSQGIPKELFRSPYRIKIPKSRVAHE